MEQSYHKNMLLGGKVALVVGALMILTTFDSAGLLEILATIFVTIEIGFVSMLVFMVTKDDLDRYGIWKTFIGSKQPSLTQMLEFGKWAVFKPIGLLMQATIIDFNNDDDALESSDAIEISSQYPQSTPARPDALRDPAAPPPPPPPPPCPAVKRTASEEGDEQKCKKLSWKELKIDLRNTVWEKVNRQLHSLAGVLDKNEIFELFKEKPRKSRKFSAHSPAALKSEDIQTIGGKKQLNISIALAHHQLTAHNLFNAINNVDIRMIEADFLSSMESFLPDQTEENSLLRKFASTDIDKGAQILTDPEKFSLLLSSVPDFRKKIRAMVFQCSFYDRVNAICQNLEIVRDAAKEVRHSGKLETVLLYILSLGRVMNNSSTEAFNIDFLSSASCFKSSDGDTTFLMYLIQKLIVNDPEALQIAEELPTLQQAVKVSLNDIDRDSTELAVEYGSLALELDAIVEQSETFKEFLRQGKFDLNHLKRKRRQVQQDLKDLIAYLGADPDRPKPMEVFSTLSQFIKDLTTANENLSKKALSRKNSSRAMMRSISAPSFKRTSRNSSFRGSRNSSAKSSRNSSARSSFRRVSRSISIASSASDVTHESQDGIRFVAQNSRGSSRDRSSENITIRNERTVENPGPKSCSVERTIENPHLKSPKTEDEGYGTGSRSLTPKTKQLLRSELKKLRKDRPMEPDLSKYRDMMNEIKNEVGKKNIPLEDCAKKESPSAYKHQSFESKGQEKRRSVLLSPVRESSSVQKALQPTCLSFGGALNDSDANNSVRRDAFVGTPAIEKSLNDKESNAYHLNGRYEEMKKQRDNEFLNTNAKLEKTGLQRFNRDVHRDGYGIRKELGRKISEREEIPRSGEQARRGEPKESNEQEVAKERSKDLKTLRCRMKIQGGKQCYVDTEKEYMSKENGGKSDTMLRRITTDDMTKRDRPFQLDEPDMKANTQLILSRTSTVSKGQALREVGKCSGTQVNGKADEGKTKTRVEREDVAKMKRNQGSTSDRSNSNSKDKTSSTKDGSHNETKSFVRGGTRSSLTKSRGSFRNSFRSDRGVKKVSVKAMSAKDVHKLVARTQSESHAGDSASQRRRTKSEGLQAVILKPGYIAKSLPLTIELGNTEVSNNNGKVQKTGKAADSGKDFVVMDDVMDREKGPVLRRTKSAMISRNIREAKIVFFL